MRSLAILLLSASAALANDIQIVVEGGEASDGGVTYSDKGTITIDLFEDIAPLAAARLEQLAQDGAYDGVAFHRVIDGFMAQTGDVSAGQVGADGTIGRMAGTGQSEYDDLPAEFTTERAFERGVVGMARSADPNSANSQFFIMFAPAPSLNGQYTIVGEVTEGMEVVDAITRGRGQNGAVIDIADRMKSVTVIEDEAASDS